MLVGIIQQYYIQVGNFSHQLLYSIDPFAVHRHMYIRKFLFDLYRFVSYIRYARLRTSKDEMPCSPFVSPIEYSQIETGMGPI